MDNDQFVRATSILNHPNEGVRDYINKHPNILTDLTIIADEKFKS